MIFCAALILLVLAYCDHEPRPGEGWEPLTSQSRIRGRSPAPAAESGEGRVEMATIDSKEMIDRIIATNGEPYPPAEGEPSEPPVAKVVEYVNFWGKTVWGVVFENERDMGPGMFDRYEHETTHVRDPRVIFVRDPSR
jgi:hypothetical protein